jgi:hypothetical protein
MASLLAIRKALKDTLKGKTSVELSVYDLVEDMGSALPAIVIEPNNADYDGAFGRGMDVWDFNLFVLVSRSASSAVGQRLLDQLISGEGPNSLRKILYDNENLGLDDGTSAHVYQMKAYGGSFEWAKIAHVGAVLKVRVNTMSNTGL